MGYVPHPLCIAAAEEVMRCIGENPEWREDADRGKMFGVLVVEDEEGRPAFLAAFSGLLVNRNDWEYFVPPVFDFQQPDGYFKREEAEITHINRQVTLLEQSREREELLRGLQEMKAAKEADLAQWKAQMETAKRRRDAMRGGGLPVTMTTEQMLRESQWMKAEMRRKRQRHDEGIARQAEALKAMNDDVARLRAAVALRPFPHAQRTRGGAYAHRHLRTDGGESATGRSGGVLCAQAAATCLQTPPHAQVHGGILVGKVANRRSEEAWGFLSRVSGEVSAHLAAHAARPRRGGKPNG